MTDVRCPLQLQRVMWPGAKFYDKEEEIVLSVRDAKETYVRAGNQLGKDYTAGYVVLSFFLCPQAYFDPRYVASVERTRSKRNPDPHTVRVVTTSVKDEHLDILWGEIGRFVTTCASPLLASQGGPVVMNHHEVRFAKEAAAKNPINYLKGMVSGSVEGLSGHHAAYTLLVMDEASGIDDAYYEAGQGWAKRMLMIGNPNPTANFYFKGNKAGVSVA